MLKNLKMGVILITRKRIKGKDTAASDKATHLVARDVPLEPTVRKAGAPACLVSFICSQHMSLWEQQSI